MELSKLLKCADPGQQIFPFTAAGKFSAVLTRSPSQSTPRRQHLLLRFLLSCIQHYSMQVGCMCLQAKTIRMPTLRSGHHRHKDGI